MTSMEILSGRRDFSGGYKVDVSRGERVSRVSSEWFSRPADERFLSLRRSGRRARSAAFGRGRAASLAATRLVTNRTRSVTVKARIVRQKARGAALSAHLAYLRREGVTKDGAAGFPVILVFMLSGLISVVRIHWGLSIFLLPIYVISLVLGIQDVRSDKLEPRQAIASFFAMVVLFTAMFSIVSFALFKLEWAHYEGDVIKTAKDSDAFLAFLLFYWWLFFDLLPVLEVTKTLHIESPLRAENFTAGLPIVMYASFEFRMG
jgi:hypothetical protein